MLSKEFYINIIGYGGGSMQLVAFLLNSNNMIENGSKIYLTLNLVAGISMMIYTYTKKAYANTVLNSIWFLITIVAIARFIY